MTRDDVTIFLGWFIEWLQQLIPKEEIKNDLNNSNIPFKSRTHSDSDNFKWILMFKFHKIMIKSWIYFHHTYSLAN